MNFFLSMVMIVTGYCNATGAPPFEGTTTSGIQTNSFVMACPPEMEFGTVIMMDGQIFLCLDRGFAIVGDRLDRWFSTCEEALEWGVQKKEVIVLRWIKE